MSTGKNVLHALAILSRTLGYHREIFLREGAKFTGKGGGCDDDGARAFLEKKDGTKTFSRKRRRGTDFFDGKK